MTNLTDIVTSEPTSLNALKAATGMSLTQLSLELISLAEAGKVSVKEGGIVAKQTRAYTPRSVGKQLRAQAASAAHLLLAELGEGGQVTPGDVYKAMTGDELRPPSQGGSDDTVYRAMGAAMKAEVKAGRLVEARQGRRRLWSLPVADDNELDAETMDDGVNSLD